MNPKPMYFHIHLSIYLTYSQPVITAN